MYYVNMILEQGCMYVCMYVKNVCMHEALTIGRGGIYELRNDDDQNQYHDDDSSSSRFR